MAPFYSLCTFLKEGKTDDERWTTWCDEWAEWIMNDLLRTPGNGFRRERRFGVRLVVRGGLVRLVTYLDDHPNQMWDDTLMKTVVPLTHIGIHLNRAQYISEAMYQFLLHI